MAGDLAVDGRPDLLGAEDALLPLLDLLHDLAVVAQLSAPLPEHLGKERQRLPENATTTKQKKGGG